MTATINQIGLLRILDRMELRRDGVTDYQAGLLLEMIRGGLVEWNMAGSPVFYRITDVGAAALIAYERAGR